MSPRIIIMGGMGPQASVELHSRILKAATAAGARNGDDFPSITHVSLPIKEFRTKPAEVQIAQQQVMDALTKQKPLKHDKIVLACNTAHLFESAITKEFKRDITSLIVATVQEVQRKKLTKVGIVASDVTMTSELYARPLRDAGVSVIAPTTVQQATINLLIGRVIGGQATAKDTTSLKLIIADLKHCGAQQVILGCTELSILHIAPTKAVLDPLQIVAPLLLGAKT